MTTDIAGEVLAVFADYCDRVGISAAIEPTMTLQQLELDSLSLVELVFELEEEFGITLGLADLNARATIGDVVVAVNRARGNAPSQTMQ